MASDLAAKICKRADQLKTQRGTVEQKWLDCYDMTYPMRGVGLSISPITQPAQEISIGYGTSKKAALLDSTGTDSARILASALKEGTTSANSRWFGLTVGAEPYSSEEKWLDEAADTLWENIHKSNYDSVGYEAMLDFSIAGMFALYIDEDPEIGGFVFEEWPLSQCYFASSKPGGPIDTVYRCFSLSAEQALTAYGDKLSERTKIQADKEPDTQVEFIHAIYPRKVKDGGKFARNMPIASCHIEVASKGVVRESGYREMPVVVPRWQLIPGSVLAVGPAFEALADMRTLNKVIEFDLSNSDMAIAGMWGAVDDGVLNPRTLRVGPRKVITVASKDSLFPLTPGGKPDLANEKILRLQAQVRRTFMADQLMPQPESPVETATAVLVRVELIRQLLGPVYGRMQSEYLKALVERCFGLAFRAGVFKPAPASLQGKSFDVRYESPQARAQRMQDVTAMDRYEAVLGMQAQAGMPDAFDVYDWDQSRRERAKLLGVPLKLLPEQDDVEAVRADRAERQAVAAQAEAGLRLAEKGIGKPTPLPAPERLQ